MELTEETAFRLYAKEYAIDNSESDFKKTHRYSREHIGQELQTGGRPQGSLGLRRQLGLIQQRMKLPSWLDILVGKPCDK